MVYYTSKNVKERTNTRDYSYLLHRFTELIPEECCILDIGCGTGEHLTYFKENNYQAFGIEPSSKMREYCENRSLTVYNGSFEALNKSIENIHNPIGGIWCAASLLHLPIDEFENVISNLLELLVKNGVFFFTVRLGEGYKWDEYDVGDEDAERFIHCLLKNSLMKVWKL